MMNTWPNTAKWAFPVGVAVTFICACSQGGSAAPKADSNETIGLQLSVVNYADEAIDDAYVNGSWTGSMGAHGGGGSFTCCASLPSKWHPGLTVEVRYQNDTMYFKDDKSYRTITVPVEPYTERQGIGAILWLFYLPGDKFKVYVSGYGPSSPEFPDHWDWPAPGPKSNRTTDPTVSPK